MSNQPEDSGEIIHFCTVITRNYLPFARAMASSLKRSHQKFSLVVLVIDEVWRNPTDSDRTTRSKYDGEGFTVIMPSDLLLTETEFLEMAMIYNAFELSCALKPWVLSYMISKLSLPHAIYIDTDIQAYNHLGKLAKLAQDSGIVLSPHITTPIPLDGRLPAESSLLAAGVYNGGLLAVGSSATEFLEFWCSRLRRYGLASPLEMQHVDQRWLDLVPSLFVHIVHKDKSYNVAYWNLHERTITESGEGFIVNGEPLRAFHFSGYDPNEPARLSRFEGDKPRFNLPESGSVQALCHRYGELLIECGLGGPESSVEYGYSRLPSGQVITPDMRRAYREDLMVSEASGKAPIANPLIAEVSPAPEVFAPVRPSSLRNAASLPLVSVLVPVFNRERYVKEVFDDLRRQTYANIEIIVVDNDSSDGTVASVTEAQRVDTRISLYQNESNLGPVENFRECLRLAKGKYVKYVMSDDRLRSDAVECLVTAIRSQPNIALATSARAVVDACGNRLPPMASTVKLSETDVVIDGRALGNMMLSYAMNLVGEPTTVLFLRKHVNPETAFTFAGGSYRVLADVALWMELLSKGNAAYVSDELSALRVHEGQDGCSWGMENLEHAEWFKLLLDGWKCGFVQNIDERSLSLKLISERMESAINRACDPQEREAALKAMTEVALLAPELLGGAAPAIC